MAKSSDMNVVEQHVEKGVLVACILLFLYVLFHWTLSSPREFVPIEPVVTRTVPPPDIDKGLFDTAKSIQDRHAIAPANVKPLPPYKQEIRKLQEVQPLDGLAAMVSLSPARTRIEQSHAPNAGTEETPALADIESVIPKPQKPTVWAGRELPRMDNPTDVAVAHVVAVYPWAKLKDQLNSKLQSTAIPLNVVVLAVEAELQERLPDGSWGTSVKVKAIANREDSHGNIIRIPQLVQYDGTNAEEVRQSIHDLASEATQTAILQPEYWDIWHPPTQQWLDWLTHLPRTSVSDLAPAGVRRGVARPAFRPAGRNIAAPAMPIEPVPTPRPVERRTNRRRSSRRSSRRRATGPEGFPGMPDFGPGGMPGDMMPGGRQPRRRQPRPRRTPVAPVRRTEEVEIPEAPESTPVPTLRDQIAAGQILVWFHDTALASMTVYRYRVRLVLVNPLLTYDSDVKNPQDARTAVVRTPFSDFSEPMSVRKATEFFLTGSSPTLKTVTVVVFTHSLGQRVKHNFTIAQGQAIGSPEKIELINPATGELQQVAADFSTGAVAIEFDFDKRVYKGIISRPTVEMLYLDDDGKLQTRIGAMDEDSEMYKQLVKETKQAEAAGAR